MTRILSLAALVALSACSGPILPWHAQMEEPAPVIAPEPVYTSDVAPCPAGDGDGIGGTGCEID